MRIPESCAQCLYDRQRKRMPDEAYLAEVLALIAGRKENDTSPMLVYRFNQAYARRFGPSNSYAEVNIRRFGVPPLTGMLVEERGAAV